jgi:SAM-dependent methyltransferase
MARVKWAERIIHAVNPVFDKAKRQMPVAESPTGYSEVQYGWAPGDLELFEGQVDLRNKIVLDAGCGPGGMTVYCAERGPKKIVGVDRSAEHIDQARRFAEKKQRDNVEFRVASLDSLPFESETFDVMMMNDVLEHIDRNLIAGTFSEAARILKRGGELALCFPPWTSFDASHLYSEIHVPWSYSQTRLSSLY